MGRGSNLIVGLDVGTTKVCTVVAEVDDENKSVRVIGVGNSPSEGLRKGVVVDIDKAVGSILKSVEDAEKMASVEIHSVFTGITGGHIRGFNSRGVAAVGEKGEIGSRDVDRALGAARAVSLPADREILHTIAQEFSIDGQGGVKEPEGMSGVRLEAEAHIITGAISAAQNVVKSVNRAGFEVEDIVAGPLASSLAVLTDDEKESGVLLVDMGGGTTDCAVFHRGCMRQSFVLAVGGDHVTNDISLALRIPISAAEEVKRASGAACGDGIDAGEEIELPGMGAAPHRSRREVSRVIEMRLGELFSLVGKQLDGSGIRRMLGAGVVLTGGGCMMHGAVDLAGRVFGLPVRTGKPIGFSGISEVIDSPAYAVGVGLAKYGYRYREEGYVSRFIRRGFLERVVGRLRGLLRRG